MSSNAILAAVPGDCCLSTVQHTGTPTGIFEDIGGVKTYITRPPASTIAYDRVLFFSADVYSPLYINNQLLADYFVSNGYLVLSPDCFEGDPVFLHRTPDNPDFDFAGWILPKRARATELFPRFVQAAKQKYGSARTKFVVVGYCFGAPDVMRCIASDDVVAGAIVHPTFLSEDDFHTVKQPLFLSCAETDQRFPHASRRRAEDILFEEHKTFASQVFSGVVHGFAVRCDLSKAHERWAKEESARSILSWFNRFCKPSAEP